MDIPLCQRDRQHCQTGPGLFEGVAWYYARYRPAYPKEAIEFLTARFNLSEATTVLDLGCGTGQVAIPLAARGIPVFAVDPDVDMLAEGLRTEQRSGIQGITWLRGKDNCLHRLRLPPLALCTMGASFHWMNRDKALATLDRFILPNGGVAILSGGISVWSGEEVAWKEVVKQVLHEVLGPDRRAGRGTYTDPQDRHEIVLARSAFGRIERCDFASTQELTVEEIIGQQLSTSYASPAQLGNRIAKFRRIMKERLLDLHPSGAFRYDVPTTILVGTR